MTDLPPLMRDQREIDREQLNLLAIFHFIGAGLAAIGLLFILGHYELMHFVMTSPKMQPPKGNGPNPAQIFGIFRWFYLIFAAWFLSSLILNVCSAIALRGRKWRRFSIVVAAVNCLHIPLGTVLGIFTIFILVRTSVCEAYEQSAARS